MGDYGHSDDLRDTLRLLGREVGPKPRPELRRRLLASLNSRTRFEGFVGRVAACLRSSEEHARSVVAAIDDEAGWCDRGVVGHRAMPVLGGSTTLDDEICLVRIEPGAFFPEHLHREPELALCLQGVAGLGGQVLSPGDFVVTSGGSEHGCRSLGDTDCIMLLRRSGSAARRPAT